MDRDNCFFKFLAVVILLLCCGCAVSEKLYCIAPTLIPGTTREMKSAGFWIKGHPFADKVVMDSRQIGSFNRYIEKDLKLTQDISALGPEYPGKELFDSLAGSLGQFKKNKYYLPDGRPADRGFFMAIENNMRLADIKDNLEIRFGFTNRYADQRILPVYSGLYEAQGDVNFDELQNSSLDLGIPLAVLHESLDGKWLYVLSPTSAGWIEKNRVSFCGKGELEEYLSRAEFCVVTSPKSDIFFDPGLTDYYDYARMGSRFPVGQIKDSAKVEIIIPCFQADGSLILRKAYLKKEDVNLGYLDYKPRVIIEQAFKMINCPYGWGGMYGEQDCSSFLQEVFATVGITLPRNSSAQAEVGALLGKFEKQAGDQDKLKILRERAAGGITLLRLDNHIMLFLGLHDGQPYVIHDTWGFRQTSWRGDRARIINRVAVTGLGLGAGSSRGSLLKRIICLRNISLN